MNDRCKEVLFVDNAYNSEENNQQCGKGQSLFKSVSRSGVSSVIPLSAVSTTITVRPMRPTSAMWNARARTRNTAAQACVNRAAFFLEAHFLRRFLRSSSSRIFTHVLGQLVAVSEDTGYFQHDTSHKTYSKYRHGYRSYSEEELH